jgi:hypothetical protein
MKMLTNVQALSTLSFLYKTPDFFFEENDKFILFIINILI